MLTRNQKSTQYQFNQLNINSNSLSTQFDINYISILQFSIDHSWQLPLEFINHYTIRQLTLKQKGFIMLENSLVAVVATSFVLIIFNRFCSIYVILLLRRFFL